MYERYAIFFTPPAGGFADLGASWLGWDSAAGASVDLPEISGLDVQSITATPRKYGFHATLKAPFYPVENLPLSGLIDAVDTCVAQVPPVDIEGLGIEFRNGFVALRPFGDMSGLTALAARIVRDLDPNRAPLGPDDIARRRRSRLSERQDAQMLRWGYPFIFEDFNFHMTLTGRVKPELARIILPILEDRFCNVTGQPFRIDAVTLMGQDPAGMFHQIHRASLSG